MALSMRILLAFPGSEKNRLGISVWEVRDRIDLGRIVRLESLIAPETGGRFDPHERAGICMARMILDRLYKRAKELKHEHLAPYFLMYRPAEEERAIALAFESGAREAVDCGPRNHELDDILRLFEADRGVLYPSREAMEKHNAVLALRDKELSRMGVSGGYAVLTDAPLMWAPCKDVTCWIDLDVKRAEPAACEASKTPISEARVGAWGEYLKRLGECDARAIFLFPSLDVTA